MKKNRRLEKNVQEITRTRELIMVERLKLAANKILADTKPNKKINMLNIINDRNDNIKRDNRMHSTMKNQISLKINLECDNNHKKEKINENFIKINFKNREITKRNKTTIPKILRNYQDNIRQNNNISYEELSLNDTLKKQNTKTGFQKFMSSVTDRVNQINHHINYSKFSRLFCPFYIKKNALNSKKKEINPIYIKLKSNVVKTEPNFINDIKKKSNLIDDNNDTSLNETNLNNKKLENLILNNNSKNSLCPEIKSNEPRILSNQYLNNMVTKRNLIKDNSLSKIINKTYSPDILNNKNDNININKDYIKRILGVRYKEYETTDGQKVVSNMLIPEIEKVFKMKYLQYKKIKNRNNKKQKEVNIIPIKVDLLMYENIIKKDNDFNLKETMIQQQIRRRILSRNVKKK